MTTTDNPANPPLRSHPGRHMLTADPATHWTRTDTALTIAAFLLTLAAIVGALAGWDFGGL